MSPWQLSKRKQLSMSSCSVPQSCLTLCNTMNCRTPASLSFTISQSLLKFMSIESVMPSNHHIHCQSLFLLPSIFPSIRGFSNSRLFTLAGQSTGALASASFHPMNSQAWFHYDWLVWSPCHPRDSQESSAIPQFKNINTSVLSPALTSLGDYGKNHSFHYTDVCWQSNVSDF